MSKHEFDTKEPTRLGVGVGVTKPPLGPAEPEKPVVRAARSPMSSNSSSGGAAAFGIPRIRRGVGFGGSCFGFGFGFATFAPRRTFGKTIDYWTRKTALVAPAEN